VIEGFRRVLRRAVREGRASVPCVPEKDAAFLRWRYGPGSPQFPVTVLAVKKGETLLGYAVLMVTSSVRTDTCSTSATLPDAATWRSAAPGVDPFLSGARSTDRTGTGSSNLQQRPDRVICGVWGFFTARGGATACWSS
jgi:hypothetical protein